MISSSQFFETYGNENEYIEFKTAAEGIPRDMWETYSSFANTSGGKIILGVMEDQKAGTFTVTGVNNIEKTKKVLWDNLHNSKYVNKCILENDDIQVVDVDDKKIIIVDVPKADITERPIFVFGDIMSGTYKRNSEGDYHCTRDEIMAMIRDSYTTVSDLEPVMSTDMDSLDMDSFKRYLSTARDYRTEQKWLRMDEDEMLEFLGICRTVDGNRHLTAAGLLMFGKVSAIILRYPKFFLDYRESTGDNRWDIRIDSNTQALNVFSFIEETLRRLSTVIGSPFNINGIRHEKVSNTFLSVREAVINALIHADYSNESIRIAIVYDGSKIVITNPGTMRVPLDRALKGGDSNPRNQAMMRIAMMGGLVEYVGSGIHFINDTVNDNGLLKFSMVESGEPLEVKTTLWLPIRGHDLNNTELAILRYIEDNDNATQNRIAEAIGVSVRTVNRTVSKLKNEGILEMGGNNRNPKWTIRKT